MSGLFGVFPAFLLQRLLLSAILKLLLILPSFSLATPPFACGGTFRLSEALIIVGTKTF